MFDITCITMYRRTGAKGQQAERLVVMYVISNFVWFVTNVSLLRVFCLVLNGTKVVLRAVRGTARVVLLLPFVMRCSGATSRVIGVYDAPRVTGNSKVPTLLSFYVYTFLCVCYTLLLFDIPNKIEEYNTL